MTTGQRQTAPDTGSSFSRRLGVYLAGVTIGLLLLGFFQAARQISGQRRAASEEPAPEPSGETDTARAAPGRSEPAP